jgi:1,4-alpha-glucan branching enzyme
MPRGRETRTGTFAEYAAHKRKLPFGAEVIDGPGSQTVREYFIANARYWIDEFHFDGFRLDSGDHLNRQARIPLPGTALKMAEQATRDSIIRHRAGRRDVLATTDDLRIRGCPSVGLLLRSFDEGLRQTSQCRGSVSGPGLRIPRIGE